MSSARPLSSALTTRLLRCTACHLVFFLLSSSTLHSIWLLFHIFAYFFGPNVFGSIEMRLTKDLVNNRPPIHTIRVWKSECWTFQTRVPISLIDLTMWLYTLHIYLVHLFSAAFANSLLLQFVGVFAARSGCFFYLARISRCFCSCLSRI